MRLVSICDANWQGDQHKPACQVQFAVNRKRKPVEKDGNLLNSSAEKKGLYQLLECIAPEHYQSFVGSFTLHKTDSIGQFVQKLPRQDFHWSIAVIAQACNDFYRSQFLTEIAKMKERNYLDTSWLSSIEQLFIERLLKRLNDGDAFLLRVGKHSGGEALTLNGVRSIRINNQGKKPDTWEKHPKTWWLAADDIGNQNNLLPFGWVLVEIDPQSPDTQLQNWLEQGNQTLTDWMQQQTNKQQALKQKAELRQRQEQERQHQEQQQAEELRQREAAEQQRLSQLSPIDRDIEQTLKDNKDPNKKPYLVLLEAIKANRWQEDDRLQVLQKIQSMMQESGDWRPTTQKKDPAKDKEHQRTLEVQKLMAS
jgi:CRISPR-associated protein Csm5